MKKLLTIAALAACLVPAFAEDVTSENIVGYKKLDLDAGFKMYAPMFLTVGGNSIGIQALKPSGDGVGGWGDVQIQIVNTEGNISASYAWMTAENSGLAGDFWVDDNFSAVDVTIADGDAILLYSEAAISLTCIGEVELEEVTKNLSAGFNSIGNTKLADIDIQELIPTGDGVGGWGDVQIQIVDDEGNISASYAWMTAENSGLADDFWVNDNFEAVDVTFTPGKAFLLYTENAATIAIPEVILGND